MLKLTVKALVEHYYFNCHLTFCSCQICCGGTHSRSVKTALNACSFLVRYNKTSPEGQN